jgi:hypothetical protein
MSNISISNPNVVHTPKGKIMFHDPAASVSFYPQTRHEQSLRFTSDHEVQLALQTNEHQNIKLLFNNTSSMESNYKVQFSVVIFFNEEQTENLDQLIACMSDSYELIFLCTKISNEPLLNWIQKLHKIHVIAVYVADLLIHSLTFFYLGSLLSSGPRILKIQSSTFIISRGFDKMLEQPLGLFQDLIAVSAVQKYDFDALELATTCFMINSVNDNNPLILDAVKLHQVLNLQQTDHLFRHAWKQFGYRVASVVIDFNSVTSESKTREYCNTSFSLPTYRSLTGKQDGFPLRIPTLQDSTIFVTLVLFGNTESIYYENAEMAIKANDLHKIHFSSIRLYNQFDVCEVTEHSPPDTLNVRGFHYWVWKPWIMLDTMKKVPENSIVVYADSGLFFNNATLFYTILESVQANGYYFFRNDHLTLPYCKCEAWSAFKNDDLNATAFYMANAAVFFIKNTPYFRGLMQEWLQLCQTPFYISDVKTEKCSNSENFVDHRHDQALLTAILRNNGLIYTAAVTDDLIFHHKSRTTLSSKKILQDITLGLQAT